MAALRVTELALSSLLMLLLAHLSSGQTVAKFVRETLESDNTLSAYYNSALFGGQVKVQVTPTTVLLSTFAPPTAANIALNETFPLPANSSKYTVVDHINVFYDPFGSYPYPAGLKNPLWNSNISASIPCPTCWFYITFFFIPQNATMGIASECAVRNSLFCSADLTAAANASEPNMDFLPKTFRRASGDFYPATVVKASVAGAAITKLHSQATVVTPLIANQMGQFWVSEKKAPYTYTYNGTTVLAPQNYYLTDNADVVGVGQVVSPHYFTFFTEFFASIDPVLNHTEDTAGPFDVPTNYSTAGNYPLCLTAVSNIQGFKGTTTFAFGFDGATYRLPPPPNAGSSLVLNLPWLIASVWIAGAIVLLSDHL